MELQAEAYEWPEEGFTNEGTEEDEWFATLKGKGKGFKGGEARAFKAKALKAEKAKAFKARASREERQGLSRKALDLRPDMAYTEGVPKRRRKE